MSMSPIDLARARRIAWDRGLKPVRIRGTNVVEFASRANTRFEVIDWNDFEANLKEKGLSVYEWRGWMKIMKNKAQSSFMMSVSTPAREESQTAPAVQETSAHEVSVEVTAREPTREPGLPPRSYEAPTIVAQEPVTLDPPMPPAPGPLVEPPLPFDSVAMASDPADLLASLDRPTAPEPRRGKGVFGFIGKLLGFGRKR